jgi:phosphinothricin acetyltransferase
VIIRPAAADDVPRLTDIYNHYIVHSQATFDIEPMTVEQRLDWFSHYGSTGPHRLLVAEDDGFVCGFATSSPHRARAAYATSVETSVYCDHERIGRGIGSMLYERLFDELAGEDLHRALAGITLPNDASVSLHERFGFVKIGEYSEVGRKFGRFWDVAWFEKRLNE